MTETSPRQFIAATQVTLDGYIVDREGASDWVDSWSDGLGVLADVDAFVLGGGMFPDYEQFWTGILEDPAAASEWLGRAPYDREIEYARIASATLWNWRSGPSNASIPKRAIAACARSDSRRAMAKSIPSA